MPRMALFGACVKSLWWAGTLDEGGFWRPLPSLVIQGSLALFGETALPLHLLAILLHGASAVLIAVLAWRLAGHFRLGLLAGVAFLACEDHSMVVGWATTITDVLGTTFTAAALVAHASWLERRRPATLVASLLALVLALGSKESVVVVPLGLVGLSAVAHARAARAGAGPVGWLAALGRDLPAWLPALLVLAGYLVAYRALGFGVGSSQLYADPFSEPLTFLGHLVVQAPVLWLATSRRCRRRWPCSCRRRNPGSPGSAWSWRACSCTRFARSGATPSPGGRCSSTCSPWCRRPAR